MAGRRQAQGMRGTGVMAALLAAALHVAVIDWLLGQRVAPGAGSAPALQVTWIEPVATPVDAATREPGAPPAPVRAPARVRSSGIVPATGVPGPDPVPGEAADSPAHARGHALMHEARAWAQRQPLQAEFVPDPLRHREITADGPFAMRDPVTVADVANAIGQLLGGPGYTTDPCPRVRRNIGVLGSGGNSELLDEELRRLRKLCL